MSCETFDQHFLDFPLFGPNADPKMEAFAQKIGSQSYVISKELIGVFGGVVGLCMGFSLLSGAEFIYFFTLRLCIVHVNRNN